MPLLAKSTLTKKALLSILAVSAVAVATPTLAQSYGGHHGGGYGGGYGQGGWNGGYNGGWNGGGNGGLNGEEARLSQRVERAAYTGQISRREAQRLRGQLDEYRRLQWRYGRDGLSRWEERDLRDRLDRIRYALHDDRRDGGWRDRY